MGVAICPIVRASRGSDGHQTGNDDVAVMALATLDCTVVDGITQVGGIAHQPFFCQSSHARSDTGHDDAGLGVESPSAMMPTETVTLRL
jgi:hypothetical protein